MQEVCRKGLGWDTKLGKKDVADWGGEWKTATNELSCMTIPRCVVGRSAKTSNMYELHIFADASERGYGAVASVRYQWVTGEYESRLLLAKARVAPLKSVTIPRLELTAVLLAVKLLRCITLEMSLQFERIQMWTDSVLVLRYLNNTDSGLCAFDANRVQQIHESTKPGM